MVAGMNAAQDSRENSHLAHLLLSPRRMGPFPASVSTGRFPSMAKVGITREMLIGESGVDVAVGVLVQIRRILLRASRFLLHPKLRERKNSVH